MTINLIMVDASQGPAFYSPKIIAESALATIDSSEIVLLAKVDRVRKHQIANLAIRAAEQF